MAICVDGQHVWFYPFAEDFCVVCGLHQMDRVHAEELEAHYQAEVRPPPLLVLVPELH